MKRIFASLLVGLVSTASLATNIQNTVDRIINHADPSLNIGAMVVDLNTSEILYQRNPTRALVPASNMKLFSDAAALLALGPDYRFRSQLTTDATQLENGVLKGSVYLYLPGDPSFSQEDLYNLFSELSLWGVKQIQGNVVLVSNNSVVEPYAPGRMASDNKYSYGAPVSPVVFDENRLTVTVNPAYKEGHPALVELNESKAQLAINNQVKTAKSTAACGVDVNLDEDNQLTARGCVGVGQWAIQQRIPIRNPLSYAKALIKSELSSLNITLNGNVTLGHAPASSLLLASHVSKPITQLMADTLKPSDNLYADSLFLHAAAKLHGSPLNWEQAQPVVKNFLQQQTGINLQQAVLKDGSGLSRQDLVTAEQTVKLLCFLYNHFPLAYEYISALPIAGQDGTLRRRFRKPTEQGLLRAKTGTMTGISSLSGYLYTANAHTLAFAIYINKTPGKKTVVSGRSLIDTLCDFFLRQKPDGGRQVAYGHNSHSRVAFQQQPTHADKLGMRYARWRQLEAAIKHAVQGQAVTVLFRGDELVLKDHGKDTNKVWSILQNLRKKYTFSVALHGETSPITSGNAPLLWVKTNVQDKDVSRTWTLREAVS